MKRISAHIRKVQGLPVKLIVKEGIREGKSKGLTFINRISASLFRAEISDTDFFKKVWSPKYQFKNSGQLREHFYKRKKPRFFTDLSNREEILPLIDKYSPPASDRIIPRVDKVCEHIFDLLGSGEISLGEKINWHTDFKTGYCWNPGKYYTDIEIPSGKADIKVPWELSRFQYFAILGQIYRLTGDEKYAREFVDEISDWINNNKPKFGVNWRSTMDVSIRVCNWILGYCYFKDSPELNNDFLLKFLKSLYQHGKHIIGNLEKNWWGNNSNHYLSDIVGLVYLGVIFSEFKEAKKWRDFGMKEPVKEMEKQVYPDGCDFEASTCYHRLVLELFFFATLLVVINDDDFNGENHRQITEKIFGKTYTERLYKMFEAVLYLLKPNGRMPQIGDNDNGRLHMSIKREVLDMRYLLTLGAIFFKESKFKVKEFGFSEEALWVFGKKGYKIWQDLEENSLASISSKAFPDAGWYIMRNDKDYMIVSCGSNGQNGNGGHCHNDKLSFELCIDGEDVIVDPGTYVYTPKPEWRNKFRSTTYHNTVVVDKKEQNEFNRKSLFEVKNDAEVKCLKWETGNEIDIFVGEHYGYKTFSQPVIHKREIKFYKKERKLEIIDKFTGEGKHNLEWNLILSPEFKQKLNISSDKLQWRRDSAFYSSEYGTITKTEKLTSILRVTIPVEVKFWIEI